MGKMDDMSKSLSYEKSQMKIADEYYRKNWEALGIERYPWGNPYGRQMQKQDIDCCVHLGRRDVYISEKFRTKDYGDMFIELDCNNRNGWALDTRATGICYFAGSSCYEVNATDIRDLAQHIKSYFGKSIEEVKSLGKKHIQYQGKDLILQTADSTDNESGNNWKTVGVCIKWNDLQDFGVNFKKRPL